ncbi:MAG: arginine--tRNA ligase, partial [Fimbriimonadales bacterium]|nr:arginine--tRNA ligase [Fimbriimonadales bacterium]
SLRSEPCFERVEVAGPGFLNFWLSPSAFTEWAKRAFLKKERLARIAKEKPERILLEFVSVNPNGPIHVGHGRGAAYGDSLARVLEAAGDKVYREYYVNDSKESRQMQLFALSVKARYRAQLGLPYEFPEEGYQGEYVNEIASRLREVYGEGHAEDGLEFFQTASEALVLEQQRADLEKFRVRFDHWFSEQSLHTSGEIENCLKTLKERGYAYEKDGALWLKSTEFGDDKDRCLVRQTGQKTYIAGDVAYHKNKFDRGFDRLIDVWGADHHGYIARTRAGISALGYPSERFEAIIVQIVRFLRHGEPVAMAKRTGELVTLRELMEEIGVDAARFFYLMRSHDAHMDFDLDLAREQSEKNPVYYVQYAHARICSVLRKAQEAGLTPGVEEGASVDHPAEKRLIKTVWDLPYEIERAAKERAVHRLTQYVTDLARDFHDFYEKCRVIDPQEVRRSQFRLALCEGTRFALAAGLELLGVSAPERM